MRAEMQMIGFVYGVWVIACIRIVLKEMAEEAPDELAAADGDSAFRIPGFKPLAEKVTSVSVTERTRLLEMAILWVYLPRYSMALPKPLKVSLIKGHQSLR